MTAKWTLADGRELSLQTQAEFDALPDGTVLVCIDGTEAVKGRDYVDGDTRLGHLAYGLTVEKVVDGEH